MADNSTNDASNRFWTFLAMVVLAVSIWWFSFASKKPPSITPEEDARNKQRLHELNEQARQRMLRGLQG